MKHKKTKKDKNSMLMTEHLAELRKTVIITAASVLVCSAAALYFSDRILMFVIYDRGYDFIYTSPEMVVVQMLKLALICGIVISLPLSATALRSFVSPAMTQKEKRFLTALLSFGILLFAVGAVFAYTIIFPFMLSFFQSIEIPGVSAYISVAEFTDLLIMVCLIFGIAFELPLVMTLLAKLGLVRKKTFSRVRKYADLLILTASAFITPPDVFSMIITALPLMLVYELGIVISGIWY